MDLLEEYFKRLEIFRVVWLHRTEIATYLNLRETHFYLIEKSNFYSDYRKI